MLPSAAAKKQQQQNADIIASLEEALETAEQERDLNLERAQQNEQRVGELEAQRDATAADVEQQFATMQERFKTREAQLLEAIKVLEREATVAAKVAADKVAALESERATLTTRLEEQTKLPAPLEERIAALTVQRDAETERASGLAEKLAQSLAEKKGVEALGEATAKQWEQQLAVQSQSAQNALREVQTRLEAAEARLPPVEQARDAEAAERARLTSELATAKAECAALAERIPPLERRLADETEALAKRLTVAEAARDDAARLREASLAEVPPLHRQIAELSSERASLAALVPKLEHRLSEEMAAERTRADTHIARAEQHAAQATAERDKAAQEAAALRGEVKLEIESRQRGEERLNERISRLQVELAAWPPKLEAAEAKWPPLQEQLQAVSEARGALEVKLASAIAEKAGVEEVVRRSEAWAEAQVRELKEANALGAQRLQAAAAERVGLLEQKESAVDGWHRAQEALAACQAEKRALEVAAIPVEKALAASKAKVAKLEAEIKETSVSARSAVRRVEETVALQNRALTVERAVEEKIEHERSKLAQVLAGERDRSQSFVEATFMQQQQLVEQHRVQLEQQRRLHDEASHEKHELQKGRAASEREVAAAAREAAVAAAAASARERDALLLTGRPENVTNHGLRSAVASKSLAEINQLLELQSSIRQGSADLQGALRSKHVNEVVGAYAPLHGPASGGASAPEQLPPPPPLAPTPAMAPPPPPPLAPSTAALASSAPVPMPSLPHGYPMPAPSPLFAGQQAPWSH